MRALTFCGVHLLLVHGLVGHMRVPEIAQILKVPALAPDLLGYGENAADEGEISLPAQVEYLHDVLHDAGIERAHLVGHSIGGAIAMLFARRYPNHTESVVNVEGNFTLKDGFWSQLIAHQTFEESDAARNAWLEDPAAWLASTGATPTPERVALARSHLENQSTATIRAMAKSCVEITGDPKYLDDVLTVLNNGTLVHLIAGERSREAWDVPGFVLDAAEMAIIPDCGHLITIEQPLAFAQTVARMVHA